MEIPGLRPAQIVAVADALETNQIDYAFGGALALSYAAEPRATADIDVNIFLPVTRVDDVLAALRSSLPGLAFDHDTVRSEIERDFQVRIDWQGTFLDLFFSFADFHRECARRAQRQDFLGRDIPVLSPEDIVIFKTLFNRPKDWIDIEKILYFRQGSFDSDYALRWLTELVGAADSAVMRLLDLMTRVRYDSSEPPPG